MKVRIDTTLCNGHSQCVIQAEEVFELTEDDAPVARVLLDVIPDRLKADVLMARDLCPAEAIIVEDEPSQ
jgi:ferredoxin